MPHTGFKPGSSAATLLEFDWRLKPLGRYTLAPYLTLFINTPKCKTKITSVLILVCNKTAQNLLLLSYKTEE